MATLARLALRGLNKTFGPTRVLAGVDLVVGPGEVHGLAGQNGSGKSTVVKIVTGVHPPDPGASLEIDGQLVRLPVRWPEVHAAGVSVVHQDLGLLDELTVADNICIGGFPRQRFSHRIDRGGQAEVAAGALRRIGADIDPGRVTESLSAPERAEVAIARALRDHQFGAGLVIMDESTRSMAGHELARVHRILRQLADEGTSVVLISHSLPELLEVTDRITILRDGHVSGAGLITSELNEQEIARRMLGSDALGTDLGTQESATQESTTDRDSDRTAPQALTVSGLGGSRVRGVSFDVGRAEVVGITGLPGSGYEDIPYLITGAIPASAGRIRAGRGELDMTRTTIARCLRAGIVLVPEQRASHGLALEMSVRDNITLPNLRRRGRRLFLGRSWQRRDADEAVRAYGIRPVSTDRIVRTLSGGNQQKVLLAKWLGAAPAVLVLHEPTQAVDVGARRDILLAIRRAAQQGVAVVLVSGEPADLTAICDRILVWQDGGELVQVENGTTADKLIERIYHHQPIEKVGSTHV